MRRLVFSLVLAAHLMTAIIAHADVNVRAEVPFRQDSGLIRAEYYLSIGKNAEALSEAEAVVKRQGPIADAYTYAGLAYARLGDEKKAVENYRRALTISPRHLGANLYLMQQYLDSGDRARAIEQMQVLRAVCGATVCEELTIAESALNAGRSTTPAPAATPQPVRGETPRDVE